jgi:4-amino-4-deoxy-L-arabinose transferase-like glycosyltransferase
MLKKLWQHPGHLIWIVLAYLPRLGDLSMPLTGDQKTYIAIAQEMREKGDWLIPRLFGEPNFLKPPFQYWMTLIGWKVFGFGIFGALSPSVLALVATSWFISEIAQILGERRWYVSAGLWFGVILGTMTYADVAQMEIHLCLFYAASWWAGLKFLATQPEEDRNYRWLYAAFMIAGLSALVKSPLYSVFWVSSFFIYLLISGEWLMFKNKHLYFACLSGIVVGLVWFIAAFNREPDVFWNQYWVQEQVGKSGGNGGTVFGLWTAFLYMAFPATLLLFAAVRSVWIGRRTNGVFRWVVAWSIPPALFFTLYPYRISPYLYILMPAVAVLVDWGCFRSNRTRTFLLRLYMFSMSRRSVFPTR